MRIAGRARAPFMNFLALILAFLAPWRLSRAHADEKRSGWQERSADHHARRSETPAYDGPKSGAICARTGVFGDVSQRTTPAATAAPPTANATVDTVAASFASWVSDNPIGVQSVE